MDDRNRKELRPIIRVNHVCLAGETSFHTCSWCKIRGRTKDLFRQATEPRPGRTWLMRHCFKFYGLVPASSRDPEPECLSKTNSQDLEAA
jgi:hypothetical protein